MVIVVFALGYFFLKLIDLVAPPPAKWIFALVTCIVAIVLIFIFGIGPIRIG